jgi:hypothetical protein
MFLERELRTVYSDIDSGFSCTESHSFLLPTCTPSNNYFFTELDQQSQERFKSKTKENGIDLISGEK